MEMIVVICGVIAFLCMIQISLPKKKLPSLEATTGINYDFSPLRELYHLAATTGEHFNHVFLRDLDSNIYDQEILKLQTENELLKAASVEAITLELADNTGVSIDGPPFKENEPKILDDYEGQPHVTNPLRKAILALEADKLVIDHKLFTGLPGIGKTLIAKVLANELHLRAQALGLKGLPFYWSFAANLSKADLLDKFVRSILEGGGGVWFIDEIHVLDDKLQTKIYSLMEDGLYPFEGDMNPTKIPNTMVVGATTDYGSLHPALKRRFGEPMMLRRINREAIIEILTKRSFPIQGGAASLLADRTHYSGAPWEAITLRKEAEIFAKAGKRNIITEVDVKEVFETYGIDDMGLRWQEREVLKALFKRPRTRGKDKEFVAYAASENDICSVAGLDPEEYREAVKGRLLSRQLIEVKTGYGQALTEQAVKLYGWLK
jgi:Holliday junction DNA helicase RuvB